MAASGPDSLERRGPPVQVPDSRTRSDKRSLNRSHDASFAVQVSLARQEAEEDVPCQLGTAARHDENSIDSADRVIGAEDGASLKFAGAC